MSREENTGETKPSPHGASGEHVAQNYSPYIDPYNPYGIGAQPPVILNVPQGAVVEQNRRGTTIRPPVAQDACSFAVLPGTIGRIPIVPANCTPPGYAAAPRPSVQFVPVFPPGVALAPPPVDQPLVPPRCADIGPTGPTQTPIRPGINCR